MIDDWLIAAMLAGIVLLGGAVGAWAAIRSLEPARRPAGADRSAMRPPCPTGSGIGRWLRPASSR
jgi:hypothetical protein